MNDTTPEIQALQHRLLMERSGEERLRMGVSMCQTGRAILRASLPAHLSGPERRVQLFVRLYGDAFDPAVRGDIIAHLRNAGGSS